MKQQSASFANSSSSQRRVVTRHNQRRPVSRQAMAIGSSSRRNISRRAFISEILSEALQIQHELLIQQCTPPTPQESSDNDDNGEESSEQQ